MADTDTPLKLLITDFADVFVPWLLGNAAVLRIEPDNPELPAGAVRSDAVFRVTLADGRETLLHIEFQGPGSDRPMPIRMLDYVSRLAQRGEERLCSVVLYVGEGTGRDDQGQYAITCPAGDVTLAWRYRVIRLWEMTVADLLDEGRTALLPLAGLMRLSEDAEAELREAMAQISTHEDEEERARMLTLLVSLMPTEELTEAMERMVGDMNERLLLDTPFLRRIREQGRHEGREEGRMEGREEGREEGLAQGLEKGLEEGLEKGLRAGIEEGVERGLRRAILRALLSRFDFSAHTYQRFENRLDAVDDEELLDELLHVALRAETLEAFDEKLGTLVGA